MTHWRIYLAVAALLAAGTPAVSGEASLAAHSPEALEANAKLVCLTKHEQHVAIAQGQAVTLASAIRSARLTVRGRGGREVVRARLCRDDGRLVYMLTVLARDGKVSHMTIDAASGKVVEAR
jgi:uncharacterized membrane protein YkoI